MYESESRCMCTSEKQHREMVARVDDSFKRDKERRESAPTSQTLVARARAARNGHG